MYLIRRTDGLFYVENDDGSYTWDKWPLTELTHTRAEQIVSTYAPSTRRKLRIIVVNGR